MKEAVKDMRISYMVIDDADTSRDELVKVEYPIAFGNQD